MAHTSNEPEWAADRKVGFAMGILLIGVVAALFFRNEPLSVQEAPSVEREELIDSRLRDRDVVVYTDEPASRSEQTDQPWTLPELFDEFGERNGGVATPIGSGVPPASAEPQTGSKRPSQPSPQPAPVFRPPVETVESSRNERATDEEFQLPADGGVVSSATVVEQSADPVEYDEYVVRYGDTLSGIADRRLGSSGRYREIFEANRDRMESPDRLSVGATIRIPRR